MSNMFIAADPGVCIGCETCMAACFAKHDATGDGSYPRLRLTLTRMVSAPVACHQCMDAPCAHACPVGALEVDDANHRVSIHQERCIGCRNCMLACPFGAIDIETQTSPVSFGNMVIGMREKPVVVKCDLCLDRPGGPACVEACPTKGLMLVDQDTIDGTVKNRRLEAAEGSAVFSRFSLNASLA